MSFLQLQKTWELIKKITLVEINVCFVVVANEKEHLTSH